MDKKKIKCSECDHSKWSEYFRAFTCEHPGCKDVPIFKGSTHPRCCPLVNPKGHYHRPTKGLGTLPRTQVYFHV